MQVHELRENQPGCRVYIAQTKADKLEPTSASDLLESLDADQESSNPSGKKSKTMQQTAL